MATKVIHLIDKAAEEQYKKMISEGWKQKGNLIAVYDGTIAVRIEKEEVSHFEIHN